MIMKKFIIVLTTLFAITVSVSAMSYDEAREQALFLTDKMAYELNLTDDQYEAAYEVNLDYLMSVNSQDDLYGNYWDIRNAALSSILLTAQYNSYIAASYFYRPLYWSTGFWHFGIYARYPQRNYFYFGRPAFYSTYRGGHSWRTVGRNWYSSRSWGARGNNVRSVGMGDRFKQGSFGKGTRFSTRNNVASRSRAGVANRSTSANVQKRTFGTRQSTSTTRSGRKNINVNSSTRRTVSKANTDRKPSNVIQRRSTSSSRPSAPNRTFSPSRSSSNSNRSFSAPSRSSSSSMNRGGGSSRGGGGAHFGGGGGGRGGRR